MVECEVCHGSCDNGELVGGKCSECIEAERQERIRADSVAKMMNGPSYQMEFGLEGVPNGGTG